MLKVLFIKSKTYATEIIFLSVLYHVVMICLVGKELKVCTKKWYYAQLSGGYPFQIFFLLCYG